MLKAHASVMINPLGGNLVKITERRRYARQLDFQNGVHGKFWKLDIQGSCWHLAEL